jgi:hypothetical protein
LHGIYVGIPTRAQGSREPEYLERMDFGKQITVLGCTINTVG